jgi:hypothetical protein
MCCGSLWYGLYIICHHDLPHTLSRHDRYCQASMRACTEKCELLRHSKHGADLFTAHSGRNLHASSQPISDGPYTRFRPSRSPFWVWTVDSFGGRYLGWWWWWSTATTAGGRPECGSRGALPNQGCVNAQAKTGACLHPLLSAFWVVLVLAAQVSQVYRHAASRSE